MVDSLWVCLIIGIVGTFILLIVFLISDSASRWKYVKDFFSPMMTTLTILFLIFLLVPIILLPHYEKIKLDKEQYLKNLPVKEKVEIIYESGTINSLGTEFYCDKHLKIIKTKKIKGEKIIDVGYSVEVLD